MLLLVSTAALQLSVFLALGEPGVLLQFTCKQTNTVIPHIIQVWYYVFLSTGNTVLVMFWLTGPKHASNRPGRVLRHISHAMWKNQPSGHCDKCWPLWSTCTFAQSDQGPHCQQEPSEIPFSHQKCITDLRVTELPHIQQSGRAKSTPGAMTTMLLFAQHGSYFFITLWLVLTSPNTVSNSHFGQWLSWLWAPCKYTRRY